jgi:uncharacterized protein (DUF488 family)
MSAKRPGTRRKAAAQSPAKRRTRTTRSTREPSLFSDETPRPKAKEPSSVELHSDVVYTIGHSTLAIEDFIARLKGHGVTLLVDVRKMPGSRRHPQFGRDALASALAREGIRYVHAPELGGFRKARPGSPNSGWRNASFQGYADYMMTPEFDAALRPILLRASEEKQALMCAEAVPWRCHRSLVADALTVRGVRVEEIQSPTRTSTHEMTPFAQVKGSEILYPPDS